MIKVSKIVRHVTRNASQSQPSEKSGSGVQMKQPGKQVKDYLGYEQMCEDGICRVEEGLYSALYSFTDVPYQDMLYEQQKGMFRQYTEFLNSYDSSLGLQIVMTNQEMNRETVREIMFLDMDEDAKHPRDNEYRREINAMIEKDVAEKGRTMARGAYAAFTTAAVDRAEAKVTLSRAGAAAQKKFGDMGSQMRFLDGSERLAQLASILRPDGDTQPDAFDYEQLRGVEALETKDLIAPWCLDDAGDDIIKFGDCYGQVLAVNKYPRTIKDEILAEFMRLDANLVVSIHLKPVEQADAIEMVDQQLSSMKSEKTRMMRKNNSKFFFTDEMLPQSLTDGIKNSELLHSDLMGNDQKMFRLTFLIFTYAKSMEELQHNRSEIERTARSYQYKFDPVAKMQRSRALRSALPLGVNKVPVERTFLTAQAGAIMPFLSESVMQKGGAYYGVHPTLKTPVILKRTSLDTPSGAIIGRSGKGKSFAAKEEITNTLLTEPTASVDVIDIEREFSSLAEGYDGEIIHISANSGKYINPFDINDNYSGEDDPLTVKTEEIIAIVQEMAKGLTAMEESLIDRACRIIYPPFFQSHDPQDIPTFTEFNAELRKQPEPQAAMLATTIERFVEGSMAVFNHRTNIDTSKRLRIWDIKDLGKSMKTIGLLIVTGQIWNRATLNRELGVRSYFYTDEWQLVLKNEYALNFYDELYTRARKWGIVPTVITQNIQRVLANETARLILSNCDFLLIMAQSHHDALALQELLNLSDFQMRQIRTERKGYGLLVAGDKIVPFENHFPENTQLYRMYTTKFDDLRDIDTPDQSAS